MLNSLNKAYTIEIHGGKTIEQTLRSQGKRDNAYKLVLLSALIIVLLVLSLATHALVVEPYVLVTVTKQYFKTSYCTGNYRIVFLSDLHFDGGVGNPLYTLRYGLTLLLVAKARPDLIVVGGDLVSNSQGVNESVHYVGLLSSIAPVVIVPGNWEYWSGIDVDRYLDTLNSMDNVTVLRNSNVVVNGRCKLVVIGVDDPYTGRDNLSKAMLGAPTDMFKLLVAHSPQVIGEAKGKVDLILAGHTHGGQVVIPFIGPLMVPLPGEYRRYVAGLYNVNSTLMYVSRGIGTSIYPVRFMCSPEIVVVELEPK